MRIGRDTFYEGWRQAFGRLQQPTVDAINLLLDAMEHDPELKLVAEAAYLLATVRWETAGTMRPIREIRAKPGTRLRRVQDRYWSTGFYGRGYPMLTWESNYRRASQRLKAIGYDVDLVAHPDLALEARYSYPILAIGMREGDYSRDGVGLRSYVTQDPPDYIGARATVNGSDHAEEIADLADDFEVILETACARG